MMNKQFYLYLCATLILMSSCNEEAPLYPEPQSPEEALSTFVLDDNFEIQVFATEPFVQDPVEMIFDEKGNIFVVEMPDYPFQPEGTEGQGRIKVLLDTDGDGKIDDTKIFADKIKDATSLQPWKGGLLVTAAPYIYYMKDEDGDMVADTKEVLFEGFFNKNQEAQITNLRFNVDNWIYAANHGQAGEITYMDGEEKMQMQGADFRFRLDKEKYEKESAPAQFGQAFNDWGHRFFTQNTIHIQNMVVPYRYLHRHPYLPSAKGVVNVSDHDLRMYQLTEAPYWRRERSNRRQKKYDEQGLNRTEYIDNHFTGASGGTHYGGDLFPEEYRGNIFTGEVMGGLVHRDVVILPSDQSQYVAQRAKNEQEKEFLASKDPWFRPAHFTVGPDGALYVVDFYRQHIETPLSIPEDLKLDMDFMRGSDMGRIYRIVPKSSSVPVLPTTVTENSGDAASYVEWIAHPNQWFRLHGQRLLLEKQDLSVLPQVKELLMNHPEAAVRLHAIYVLEGLDALDESTIQVALKDENPRVREYGLILAETYPKLVNAVIALAQDSDNRVVMQTALSLGNYNSSKIYTPLAQILENNINSSWIRTAVLSSEAGSSMTLWNAVATKTNLLKEYSGDIGKFVHDFGYVQGGKNDKKEILSFVQKLTGLSDDYLEQGLMGLSKGLKRSKTELADDVKETILKAASKLDSKKEAIEKNLTPKKK
ncbi:PVC-type heme-binding CxxCH protein [Membranihabitans marinus]|uniref:PVC-type heme-binding CxxCH protein n=1 Tax=Membranihabitans marinus TaxID=1227546 RepID=UPI001F2B2B91|nr:PVC-type heme-binding CxxCH protein [Membranihabitans marinus]